ncbi:hypothetical protein ABT275_03495 [Streptomyces sp. NPDC001185]|uniref:hypothetical protein n=1 Tax=Streptomyces sp. NPDC001185 TaxID=3154380 RepID=UPI00332BB4E0
MTSISVKVDLPPLITFLPALWYVVTARDDNQECENAGETFEINPCYSNGGKVIAECGLCSKPMTLVSATLLDPQPQMS